MFNLKIKNKILKTVLATMALFGVGLAYNTNLYAAEMKFDKGVEFNKNIADKEEAEDIKTDKKEVKDIKTDKKEVKDIKTDKEEVKDIKTDKEEAEDIKTDKKEVKDIKAGKEEAKDIKAGKEEAKDVKTDKKEVKDIKAGKEEAEDLKTDKKEVKDIKTDKEEAEDIKTDKKEAEDRILPINLNDLSVDDEKLVKSNVNLMNKIGKVDLYNDKKIELVKAQLRNKVVNFFENNFLQLKIKNSDSEMAISAINENGKVMLSTSAIVDSNNKEIEQILEVLKKENDVVFEIVDSDSGKIVSEIPICLYAYGDNGKKYVLALTVVDSASVSIKKGDVVNYRLNVVDKTENRTLMSINDIEGTFESLSSAKIDMIVNNLMKVLDDFINDIKEIGEEKNSIIEINTKENSEENNMNSIDNINEIRNINGISGIENDENQKNLVLAN